jgi:hypothetical protein
MATRQKASEPPKINYYVSCSDGDFVFQIPADWKVTFGAVNPGAGNMGRHDLHCLRIWEGEKLRGVICNVRGVRDLSIPLMRKVSKETGSASWTRDSTGGFTEQAAAQIETSFEADVIEDIPF